MNRIKHRIELKLTAGSALSSDVTVNSSGPMVIEVPDADKAKAVTVQTLSGITGLFEDVVTLANTTTKYKGLTATEAALVEPLDIIRLKFASNVASTSKAVLHVSS